MLSLLHLLSSVQPSLSTSKAPTHRRSLSKAFSKLPGEGRAPLLGPSITALFHPYQPRQPCQDPSAGGRPWGCRQKMVGQLLCFTGAECNVNYLDDSYSWREPKGHSILCSSEKRNATASDRNAAAAGPHLAAPAVPGAPSQTSSH